MIDLYLAAQRGHLAVALAQQATTGAHELLASAYAEAIKRNARLRARFRRRTQGAGYHENGGFARWHKRQRHDWWTRVTWGHAFTHGPLPRCYVEGRLLLLGKVVATAEQAEELEYQIEHYGGDLPCDMCPSSAVGLCLTHWFLYHAGAARCFRCERHPAARPGTMPGVISGPLWAGRKSVGFVMAPSPAPPPMLVLG